ncbi:hypothetical protein LPJ53_005761 [Coemansia erecta]|uniref:Uncharacterized protein n=1 Tax=Coemansia erecta TaxID=147472 RepID=A0A9W8CPG1_9FUNG|nr:hypothetical protein LPJ53_005761 [Coemansia erecta]
MLIVVEVCLDKMYQLKKETDVPGNVADFEKELQLKQHLAALLAKESPISSQTEMNVALWKSQPYVYSIVAPSASD